MWFEVTTSVADPWQLGWEAVAAIGTIAATCLAATHAVAPLLSRYRELVYGPILSTHISATMSSKDTCMADLHVYNSGEHPIFKVTLIRKTGGTYEGVLGPIEKLKSGATTNNKEYRSLWLITALNDVPPSDYWVMFADYRTWVWAKNVATDKYIRMDPLADGVWRPVPMGLRRLLGAPWAAFRRLLGKINLEGFEGLLILTILALIGYIIWA